MIGQVKKDQGLEDEKVFRRSLRASKGIFRNETVTSATNKSPRSERKFQEDFVEIFGFDRKQSY